MRSNNYGQMIEWVFFRHFKEGDTSVEFERDELEEASQDLGIPRAKNIGDVIYSFRYRKMLPHAICATAPDGKEWVIRGGGRSKYRFDLVDMVRIRPNDCLPVIKIPDATPEIINASALGDEQALLALVRYNRLVDVFLGLTAYSLQNHLRTTASGVGQVEIDEVYVAVDQAGQEFVVPVQAKGHSDEIGVTQPEQDLAVCREKWPYMIPLPVAVQFMESGIIAMFLLGLQDGQIVVLREVHYELSPYMEITPEDRALSRAMGRANGLLGLESRRDDASYAMGIME